MPDTLFLVVLALIVFGPKKLPEISRQIGKLLYEFRKASNDFKFQIEEELRSAEQAERQKELTAQAAALQPATPIAITAGETVSAEPAIEGSGQLRKPTPRLPLPSRLRSLQPPKNRSPDAPRRQLSSRLPVDRRSVPARPIAQSKTRRATDDRRW